MAPNESYSVCLSVELCDHFGFSSVKESEKEQICQSLFVFLFLDQFLRVRSLFSVFFCLSVCLVDNVYLHVHLPVCLFTLISVSP